MIKQWCHVGWQYKSAIKIFCSKSCQPSLVYINTHQCRCMLVSGVMTQFALIKISHVWHAYSTTTRRHTFTTSSFPWPLHVRWALQLKCGGVAGAAGATGSTNLTAAIRTCGHTSTIHTRSVHSTSQLEWRYATACQTGTLADSAFNQMGYTDDISHGSLTFSLILHHSVIFVWHFVFCYAHGQPP